MAALGEGAELAAVGADVGVVDVAVDDEGHHVADARGPQPVGGGRERPVLRGGLGLGDAVGRLRRPRSDGAHDAGDIARVVIGEACDCQSPVAAHEG